MTYHLYGGPASPYSLKLRAVFRYRRIAHTWLVPQGGFTGTGSLGGDADASPLAQAKKGVVPVVHYPRGEWKADSTPIILELESLHEGRSVVPPNPAVAFLAWLIEDMADEYLPFPMFYFRWTEDAAWCGRRQMIGWNGAMREAQLQEVAGAFAERQRNQLGAMASMPREQVQQAYQSILDALEKQFEQGLFLFGTRPSLAEFGLYGQLSQYAVDPFTSNLMKERAVRVYQWTQYMDDLSGIEGDWAGAGDCMTPELTGILAALAPGYFFMMERAMQQADMERVGEALNGLEYRVKCLLLLKQALEELDASDRAMIQPLLEQTGCWDALQFRDGEKERVIPLQPG